jgi:predicted acyl esterase
LEGHRLRVDVCGALFPLYDRNPNTGEGPFGSGAAIATETVLHQPDALSRVILPCLKK